MAHGARGTTENHTGVDLLFTSNPLPMWVYDLKTLQFLEVNDATVAQYGYSRDELLDMRMVMW
jgi:PAS domain S-box-containing protein